MNTIELFSGTESFSKVAKTMNYNTLTIDNNPKFDPDICCDIFKITPKYLGVDGVDILWASPPCTTFSVASIGRHWNKDGTPKSDNAELGLRILEHTIRLIAWTRPKLWYIENPRGMMRKVIDKIFLEQGMTNYVRHTITYCQYGDTRMKPSDIWTNDKNWKPRPACKNGSPCHVSAPRVSRTGTQGLKCNMERSVVPKQLINEILRKPQGTRKE